MTLLEQRNVFQPFEYEQAYDYWLQQQQSHWLHTELSMQSSIQDWHERMSETERKVIAGVLLGFTQTEVLVGKYWAQRVPTWFPKPEIMSMAFTFAAWEGIHAKSYNYLSESLGLEEYDAFLQSPAASAKLENLINCPSNELKDIALSLAVYSAFAEGVSLFSSFAILLHFSRPPASMMKGVGDIITFSIKDESLHSNAGCWLYRTLVNEFPGLKVLAPKIQEAAVMTVLLEDDFIDMVFANGAINGLDPEDLKQFIRWRTNTKLSDLGIAFSPNLLPVDKDRARNIMSWFNVMTAGESNTDFFAGRVHDYSKGVFNPDTIDWNVALAS